MDFEYKCPTNGCNQIWSWDDTSYRGGTRFFCTGCNQRSTIPLYCPRCNPPGTRRIQYLNTPDRLLGGDPFRCPSNHTFTVKVSHEEVYSKLDLLGSSVGSRYVQASRIETLPQNLKTQVSGGMCAGVAMDWIRRALLGGKYDFRDGKQAPDKRGAEAQVKISGATDFWNQKNTQRTNDINRLKREALQDINNMPNSQVPLGTTKQDLYNRRTLEITEQNPSLGATMDVYWNEYCTHMDRIINQARIEAGKQTRTTRGFDKLEVKRAVDSKEYNGVAAFANIVLNDGAFVSNRAAHIGINPPRDGAVGHAVAILRDNTGQYLVFDPNFGTYRVSMAGAREALVYIFVTAYPNMGSGNDAHAYEERGKIRGDYTIFEGRQAPVVVPNLVLPPPRIVNQQPPMLQPLPRLQVEQIVPQNGNPQNQVRVANRNQFEPRRFGGAPPQNPQNNPQNNQGGGVRNLRNFFEQQGQR